MALSLIFPATLPTNSEPDPSAAFPIFNSSRP